MKSQRRRFLEVAARWSVPEILLICQADAAVVKNRLDERRDDVSDADWVIYLEAAQRWEPLGPRTRPFAQAIDTGRSDSLIPALDTLRKVELWG